MTPLDRIAEACLQLEVPRKTCIDLFDNYDCFLAVLDDKDKREALTRLGTHEELRASPPWREVREVSTPFHEALVSLFLADNEELRRLTMKYGLF